MFCTAVFLLSGVVFIKWRIFPIFCFAYPRLGFGRSLGVKFDPFLGCYAKPSLPRPHLGTGGLFACWLK